MTTSPLENGACVATEYACAKWCDISCYYKYNITKKRLLFISKIKLEGEEHEHAHYLPYHHNQVRYFHHHIDHPFLYHYHN